VHSVAKLDTTLYGHRICKRTNSLQTHLDIWITSEEKLIYRVLDKTKILMTDLLCVLVVFEKLTICFITAFEEHTSFK
jgi:hypothetical protein